MICNDKKLKMEVVVMVIVRKLITEDSALSSSIKESVVTTTRPTHAITRRGGPSSEAGSFSPTESESITTVNKQLIDSAEVDCAFCSSIKIDNQNCKKLPKKTISQNSNNSICESSMGVDLVDFRKPITSPPIITAGYLRLHHIIGDPKKGIPPVIPVSKSTWWAGVKSGRYPQPVKLSSRTTAWLLSDIISLLDSFKLESI